MHDIRIDRPNDDIMDMILISAASAQRCCGLCATAAARDMPRLGAMNSGRCANCGAQR